MGYCQTGTKCLFMKAPKLSFFVLLLVSLLWACKSGSDTPVAKKPSLTISSDKVSIVADGTDKVTFNVLDQDGKDVTASCIFSANGIELLTNVFTTKEAGKFVIVAKNTSGVVSNELSVSALSEKANYSVVADKKAFVADGTDMVVLSLKDEDLGIDLTDEAQFFLDGKAIEGRIVRGSEVRTYTVTAKWRNKETKRSLTIAGTQLNNIQGRQLIETVTSTDCKFCKTEITTIEEIMEKSSRVAVVSIHTNKSSLYTEASGVLKQSTLDKATAFTKLIGSSSTPNSIVGRAVKKREKINTTTATTFINNRIPSSANVAIALETAVSDGKITVKATATSKVAVTGKICAVLVENGITAEQYEMGVVEMKSLMRDYQPDINGQDFTLEVGKKSTFNATFELDNAKAENCKVIVFVTNDKGLLENLQQVKVGQSIGY